MKITFPDGSETVWDGDDWITDHPDDTAAATAAPMLNVLIRNEDMAGFDLPGFLHVVEMVAERFDGELIGAPPPSLDPTVIH